MQRLNIFDFQAYIACFDHLNKQSVTNREGHYITMLVHNSHSKSNRFYISKVQYAYLIIY